VQELAAAVVEVEVAAVEVEVPPAAVREAQGVRRAVVLVEEAQEVEKGQAVVGAAQVDLAVAGQAVVGAAQVLQVQADRVQADRVQVVVQADRAAHRAQAGVVAQAVVAAKVEGQGPEVADQVEVADQTMGKEMGNVEGRERAAAARLKVGPAREEVELISISP
jgi:hypothetical protein